MPFTLSVWVTPVNSTEFPVEMASRMPTKAYGKNSTDFSATWEP